MDDMPKEQTTVRQNDHGVGMRALLATLVRVHLPRPLAILVAGALLAGGVLATSGAGASGVTTAATVTSSAAEDDGLIAPGVSVGGVPVGGRTEARARIAASAASLRPARLVLGRHHFSATAHQLGFHVYAATPVRAAYAIGRTSSQPAGDIPLVTRLAGGGMQRYLRYLQRTFERTPTDAHYAFSGTRLKLWHDLWGRRVDKAAALSTLL